MKQKKRVVIEILDEEEEDFIKHFGGCIVQEIKDIQYWVKELLKQKDKHDYYAGGTKRTCLCAYCQAVIDLTDELKSRVFVEKKK